MSDTPTPLESSPESDPTTKATGPFAAAPNARDTGALPPASVLTRPSDHAPKPGFRSPPNSKSKAQKKRK